MGIRTPVASVRERVFTKGVQIVDFSKIDLNDFLAYRGKYLNPNTFGNIKRIIGSIWSICQGIGVIVGTIVTGFVVV